MSRRRWHLELVAGPRDGQRIITSWYAERPPPEWLVPVPQRHTAANLVVEDPSPSPSMLVMVYKQRGYLFDDRTPSMNPVYYDYSGEEFR